MKSNKGDITQVKCKRDYGN